jgi:hypothetical protein
MIGQVATHKASGIRYRVIAQSHDGWILEQVDSFTSPIEATANELRADYKVKGQPQDPTATDELAGWKRLAEKLRWTHRDDIEHIEPPTVEERLSGEYAERVQQLADDVLESEPRLAAFEMGVLSVPDEVAAIVDAAIAKRPAA